MKLTVKQSNDLKFEIDVQADQTVLQFKELIATASSIPAAEQRLIYSGKVLKDADLISQYKIESGHTVHMVRGRAAAAPQIAAATTAAPGQQPAPAAAAMPQNLNAANPFAALLNAQSLQNQQQAAAMNPMMQAMFSNPQMMEQLLASNPMLQQMGIPPEQLRGILQDPMFQQMMQNPAVMQQAMAMGGGQQGGAAMPGMFGGMPAPAGAQDAGQQQQQPQQLPPLGGPMMMPELMRQMMNPQQPQQPQQPPEIRFATQLQQMQDMGFYDAAANVRALSATGGNVNAAVEYLFSQPQ